jgi:hypothetical protein
MKILTCTSSGLGIKVDGKVVKFSQKEKGLMVMAGLEDSREMTLAWK